MSADIETQGPKILEAIFDAIKRNPDVSIAAIAHLLWNNDNTVKTIATRYAYPITMFRMLCRQIERSSDGYYINLVEQLTQLAMSNGIAINFTNNANCNIPSEVDGMAAALRTVEVLQNKNQ